MKFIGLDTSYPTVSGIEKRRIHLDGAASPLACETAVLSIQSMLNHYSNTHSHVHNSAKISTQAFAWAQQSILDFLAADSAIYTCLFSGSGTTSSINRLARGLSHSRASKTVALVSSMEHHANDLPHREHIKTIDYIPLVGEGATQGAIDLDALEALLQKHQGNVNYLAVTATSNVTGISNPIYDIAELAHRYGALLIVDAAQAVAHKNIHLSQSKPEREVDFFVFSGHKVYTPCSPGVLIGKKSELSKLAGQDLGGGMVSHVSYFDYISFDHYPDREQAGTPNIVGAVALAKVMKEMQGFGMDNIEQHDQELMAYLIEQLQQLDKVTIYGDSRLARTGALAFNHQQIDHGLLAAILNDYYAIAVRNECFCAHPYVSDMLKESLWSLSLDDIPENEQQNYINLKRGMVRASISLYNSKEDVDALIFALKEIEEGIDELEKQYEISDKQEYVHKHFCLNWQAYLD